MTKKIITLLLTALVLFSCGDYKKQKEGLEIRATEVSERIDNFFKVNDSKKSPGYALLIMHQDEVIHSAGYGMANFDEGLAISPITSFRDDTMMNEMISLGVLSLVDQGKISLNDSISDYIPELAVHPSGSASIEQLLDSTSGFGGVWDYLDERDLWTSEEMVQFYLENDEVESFEPGTGCYFSSIEIYFFGTIIIEAVSGQSLDSFIDGLFVQPLGLENTQVVMNGEATAPDVYNYKRRTDGYVPITVAEQEHYPQINICLNDIAKFYNALDNGELLSQDLMNLYYRWTEDNNGVTFVDETNENDEYYTGYWSMAGYSVFEFEGEILSFSNGSNDEYGTVSLYYPEQKLRIFIYSNLPGSKGFNFLFRTFLPVVGEEWL